MLMKMQEKTEKSETTKTEIILPTRYIEDLLQHTGSKGIIIHESALKIFKNIEKIIWETKIEPCLDIFLLSILKNCPGLRGLMVRSGRHPELAISFAEEKIRKTSFRYYGPQEFIMTYSEKSNNPESRASLVNNALSIAKRNNRNKIFDYDILESLLDIHDEILPVLHNERWADENLHVPFNTLSHCFSNYCEDLWIKFDDIRKNLGIMRPEKARLLPFENAPVHVKGALLSFFSDNPDYHKNVFVIMPFRKTLFHKFVFSSIDKTLRKLNFNPLRADSKLYSDDLLTNIEAHLYGSKFCVAVHDQTTDEPHNPNVTLEIGYALGLKKSVCLLKEKKVRSLPSDLQGRIYVEFNEEKIDTSIEKSLIKWIQDKNLNRDSSWL